MVRDHRAREESLRAEERAREEQTRLARLADLADRRISQMESELLLLESENERFRSAWLHRCREPQCRNP